MARKKAPPKKKAAKKKAPTKPGPGMRDAAIKAKTGKTWAQWLAVLDKAGAAKMSHAEIAQYLHDTHEVPGWWSQMVTVGYERLRGRRRLNETTAGFRTSVSRTFDAGLSVVFGAWDNAKARAKFLKDAVRFSTRNPGKNLRFAWKIGRVEVRFVVKGPKTQMTVDHVGITSPAEVARWKAFWTGAVDKLTRQLRRA